MPIPNSLKEAYEQYKLIVCTGPCLAAKSKQLIEVCEELMRLPATQASDFNPKRAHEQIRRGRTEKVLNDLRLVLGVEFERQIEDMVSDYGRPVPELARAIAALRPKLCAVYTTGLDRFIERAFRGRWPAHAAPKPDTARQYQLIFKLNGTIEKRDTWILTEEQINREFAEFGLRRRVLQVAFQSHSVLFVGFEPDCPQLERLISMMPFAGEADVPEHFLAAPTSSPSWRRQLHTHGITIIPTEPQDVVWEIAGGRDNQSATGTHPTTIDCPYPGLEPFSNELAPYFFGRHAEISDATTRLGGPGNDGHRWLAIEGPSGVGKSSFLRAGVIPALERGFAWAAPSRWTIAIMRPGREPVESLVHAVCTALECNRHKFLTAAVRDQPDGLAEFLRMHADPRRGFLLAVDQLEEIVTLASEEEREIFTGNVAAAFRAGSIYLATTTRSDFVNSLQAHATALGRLLNDHAERYLLPPISRVGMREAISEPASLCQVEIDRELVQRIASDAEGINNQVQTTDAQGIIRTHESALPLVAHVMRWLWDNGGAKNGIITIAQYKEIQGVAGALSYSADEIFNSLDKDEQQRTRALLLQLVEVNREGLDTRRPLSKAAAVNIVGNDLLDVLSGGRRVAFGTPPARLITVSEEDGQPRVEIVHEALIREWGMLRQWIEEDRRQLLANDELARRARKWRDDGKPRRDLPKGTELAQLLSGVLHGDDRKLQREYQSVLRRAERGRKRLRRGVTGTFLTLATILILVFRGKQQEADRLKNEAEEALAAKLVEELAKDRALDQARRKQLEAEDARAEAQQNEELAQRNEEKALGEQMKAEAAERRARREAWRAKLAQALAADGLNAQKGQQASMLAATARGLDALVMAVEAAVPYRTKLETLPIPIAQGINDALQLEIIGEIATLKGHTDTIMSVEFSPKDERILSASADNTARIWSLEGKPIVKLVGHTSEVTQAVFVEDGDRVITAGGSIRLWHAGNGAHIRAVDTPATITQMTVNSDRTQILTGDENGRVTVWSLPRIRKITELASFNRSVTHVAFANGHDQVIASQLFGSINLWPWDGKQAGPPIEFGTDKGLYSDLGIAPSSAFLVTTDRMNRVTTWNIPEGKKLAQFGGHTDSVNAVAISTASLIASASDDHTVEVWAELGSKRLFTLKGHDDAIVAIEFSPNGNYLATASDDQTVKVWSMVTGECVAALSGHSEPVYGLAFSHAGTRLATLGEDNNIRVWAWAKDYVGVSLAGHSAPIESVRFTRDGGYAVTGSDDGYVRIWNVSSGELLKDLQFSKSKHPVGKLAVSPTSDLIAAASMRNPVVRVWSAPKGRAAYDLEGHKLGIMDVKFSPNGKYIATVSIDDDARVWRASDGAQVHHLKGHDRTLTSLAFSRDSTLLATGAHDATARIWNMSTGRLASRLDAHPGGVVDVDFAPDGGRLVTASVNDAFVWKIGPKNPDKPLVVLRGHTDYVIQARFSPDGSVIATASADGTAALWRASDGQRIHVLEDHELAVNIVTFSPNGRFLVTGSDDGDARLWQVKGGKMLAKVGDHDGWVLGVEFSPNGELIATASWDGTARILGASPEMWLRSACRRLRGFLAYRRVEPACRTLTAYTRRGRR